MAASGPAERTEEEDDERAPKRSSISKIDRINCSWVTENAKSWIASKESYIFAEAHVSRGFNEDENEEPGQPERMSDRQEPIVSRISSSQAYPVVDSFPHIFPTMAASEPHGTEYTAIDTVLSMSDVVVGKIKGIKESISWRVGVDEREALMNSLDEIVDGYQHGYDSDSDMDEDD